MGLRRENLVTFLDNVWTTGAWQGKNCSDFQHMVFSFATDWGWDAALTVKFQWSTQETMPNFWAAQSVTNMWDYIQVADLNTATFIDWDTGISVAPADDYRLLEANVNGLKWVNARVTARTEWEVTVKWCLFSNN
jgi:hypothetical protein